MTSPALQVGPAASFSVTSRMSGPTRLFRAVYGIPVSPDPGWDHLHIPLPLPILLITTKPPKLQAIDCTPLIGENRV